MAIQINCKHFNKNPKQAGYTYGLYDNEEIVICSKCNTSLRKNMVLQLADEEGLKLMHAKK